MQASLPFYDTDVACLLADVRSCSNAYQVENYFSNVMFCFYTDATHPKLDRGCSFVAVYR